MTSQLRARAGRAEARHRVRVVAPVHRTSGATVNGSQQPGAAHLIGSPAFVAAAPARQSGLYRMRLAQSGQ